jgi:hydroxypyruvate isomerase
LQTPADEGIEVLDWMMDRLRACNYRGYVSVEYLPEADFDIMEAIAALKLRYGSSTR